MKQFTTIRSLPISLFLLFSIVMFSCKNDTTTPAPRIGTITQSDLDASTTPLASNIVGDQFDVFTTLGLPAPDTTTIRHRVRDVFSSIGKSTAISEGTVLIRESFYTHDTTSKVHDSLFATMIMIKREPGYFPGGGDWEYAFIKYGKPADTMGHRYGLLPADSLSLSSAKIDSTKTGVRGKLQTRCANCHAAAHDNGFVYMR